MAPHIMSWHTSNPQFASNEKSERQSEGLFITVLWYLLWGISVFWETWVQIP